jgi:hypothetical protein
MKQPKAPLNDQIIIVVSRLVDDAQKETREPSHSDLEFQIQRAGLTQADPKSQGLVVGKAKRVRGTLQWALDKNLDAGERLVAALLSLVQGCGGFRNGSPNFVGHDAIRDAQSAFRAVGVLLGEDGELSQEVLEGISGIPLTEALQQYIRRAKRGVQDAALLVGTSKDLLEATAAHVVVETWGSYPQHANFPTLLGQAFTALDLATTETPIKPGEHPRKHVERALFATGCAVNKLRNREGSGHGRPWISTVSPAEARTAVELMGTVSEFLLEMLKSKK